MKAHMSELAKSILRDEDASKRLDEIVYGSEKHSKNKKEDNEIKFHGKTYTVKFVDR